MPYVIQVFRVYRRYLKEITPKVRFETFEASFFDISTYLHQRLKTQVFKRKDYSLISRKILVSPAVIIHLLGL